MTEPIMASRRQYIDTARGMALIFLILGHIATGNSFFFNWIFSFHMMLFFFLSGMCIRPEHFGSFPVYLKKKLKARMLPYFVIALIGFLICMAIPDYRRLVLEDGAELQLWTIFYNMQPRNLYVGQIWFLPALFFSELYFFFWYRFFGEKHPALQLLPVVLFVVIARHLWRLEYRLIYVDRLPFKMNTAFIAVVFLIAGYYAAKYNIFPRFKKWSWILIPVLLFINTFFGAYLNGYINICDMVFGNIFYFLIAAFSGIFAMVWIALCLDKIKPLSFLGRNSLLIFASHTFMIYFVREVIYRTTGTLYEMMANVPLPMTFLMAGLVLLFSLPLILVYNAGYRILRQKKMSHKG